jgi:RNA polymerase sigma factor (sigma-70 family)
VDRFGGLVWATARAGGLSTTAAADVSQTTWLRLAEHLGRLREPEKVAGWLVATTRHEAMRVSRLESRTVPIDPWAELDSAVSEPEPHEAFEERQLLVDVHSALGQLPTRCRSLLVALTADAPYSEISRSLGMPVGSIGPIRARCLKRLRALLANAERPVPGAVGAARGVSQ